MSRHLRAIVAVRLDIRPSPDDLDTLTYRFTPSPDGARGAYVGFGDPRVTVSGFGDITRAVSSLDGNYEVPTWSVTLADHDGVLRGLLANPATNGVDFGRWEVTAEFLSQDGTFAELAPIILFRGVVTEATPQQGRQFLIQAKDILGGHLRGFDLDALVPMWKLKDDFGLSPEWPEANDNALAAIVCGDDSDHGSEVLPTGATAEKGLVPAIYTGKELISNGFPGTPPDAPVYLSPPTVVIVVTGSGPSHRVDCAATLLTHFGETNLGPIVTVPDYPNPCTPTHYATWTINGGTLDPECIAWHPFVLDGGGTPKYRLDELNNGATFINPETSYVDDGDDSHFKGMYPGPPGINTAQVAAGTPGIPGSGPMFWDRWIVAAFVLPFPDGAVDFFGADLEAQGGTTKRVLLNASVANSGLRNSEIIAPGDALWPHANAWIEVNNRRYSGFYTRGARSTQAINGNVAFALNIPGYCENPDGTGLLLDQAGPIGQWFLSNCCGLDPTTPTYTNGSSWNDVPLFANGDPKLQTSAFAQFQTDTATAMGTADGPKCRFVINTAMTLREWLGKWGTTFYGRWRVNHFGQLGPKRMPHGLSSTGALNRDRIEVKHWLTPAFDRQVVTEVTTVFDYDSELQQFRRQPARYQDDDAFEKNGNRPKTRDRIELPFTGDPLTAEVSSRYWLALYTTPRRLQPWERDLSGISLDLSDPTLLTHYDGLGATGESNTQMWVDRHVFSWQRQTVTITGLDLSLLPLPTLPTISPLRDEDLIDGNLGDETSSDAPPVGAFALP